MECSPSVRMRVLLRRSDALTAFAKAVGVLAAVTQLILLPPTPAHAQACDDSIRCRDLACVFEVSGACGAGANVGDACNTGVGAGVCQNFPCADAVCCVCVVERTQTPAEHTQTPTDTATSTPSDTPTSTPTRTPTRTPTATRTRTSTKTPTDTPGPACVDGVPANPAVTGMASNRGDAWSKLKDNANGICDAFCAARNGACTSRVCRRNGAAQTDGTPAANCAPAAGGGFACTANITKCPCKCKP